MSLSRRDLLSGLGAAALGCRWGGRATPCEDALARAVAWLWDQQAEDGGFHSVTLGFFRGGASLTGLCLGALARAAPRAPLEAARADRAVRFLISARSPDGALGMGLVPDYPTYATSLALLALAALRPEGWREQGAPMASWLQAQQLRGEAWGEHPSRGGFPMGGAERAVPPHAGHVDLSMTRMALCALAAHGLPGSDPLWAEARRFVTGCRSPGGGFRYAPGEPGLNKGEGPESGYGTATADGILAMRALPGPYERQAEDLAFLASLFRADANPGVGGAFRAFGPAMRFYWRATAADALASRPASIDGAPPGWAGRILASLRAEQRADGSFVNERGEQKENDPLIATALAVHALAASLDESGGSCI